MSVLASFSVVFTFFLGPSDKLTYRPFRIGFYSPGHLINDFIRSSKHTHILEQQGSTTSVTSILGEIIDRCRSSHEDGRPRRLWALKCMGYYYGYTRVIQKNQPKQSHCGYCFVSIRPSYYSIMYFTEFSE